MQEVIELSDSNDEIIQEENLKNGHQYSNHSIEVIDLSTTDHAESKSILIPNNTVITDDPLPSSPIVHCTIPTINSNSIHLESDNDNNDDNNNNNKNYSMEISAPLIHDDTTNHSDTDNADISIISHNTSKRLNKAKLSNKGLLDDIISDNDSSSDDMHCDSSTNKDFGLNDIVFRWSPEKGKRDNIVTTDNAPTSTEIHKDRNPDRSLKTQSLNQEISNNRSPSPSSSRPATHMVEGRNTPDDIGSIQLPLLTDEITDQIQTEPSPNEKGIPGSSVIKTNNNNGHTSKSTNIRVRRIISKGKPLTENVALDIPMFLDDSDSDINTESSSPLKKKRNTRRISTQPIPFSNIVLPLARSKTAETIDSSNRYYNNDDHSTLKAEYARLSNYIINAKSFSESESKEEIRACLTNNKDAFKKANQICKDNQKVREQMIIELPNSLLVTFEKVQNDFRTLLEPATIQTCYNSELPQIRFLRRVDNVYDFNHDYYYPSESKIMEENEILLYYDAKTFFKQYSRNKRTLYKSIRKLTKRNKYVIVVLYDLNKLKRTIELIEDHQYKARVNERLSGSSHSDTKSTKNLSKPRNEEKQEIKDLNMKVFDIEQRIRFIDREWKIKVHTCNSHLEFIHSLPNLTTLIAKKRTDPALRFMKYAHINVRSGSDSTDILKKTLHEIGRIPELKTRGISKQYPNLQRLFQDFSIGQLQSGSDGRHLLTENMERRLFKLFTCQDPNEVID